MRWTLRILQAGLGWLRPRPGAPPWTPTLARGVALSALLACGGVGVTGLATRWPSAPAEAVAACADPVEVRSPGGRSYLGCARDPGLEACRLRPGDRAELHGRAGCTAVRGGMRAGWRLMQGLKLDINRATSAELQLVEGLGPKTAAALVAWRRQNGPWQDLQQLRAIPGLGQKSLTQLAASLEVAPAGP